MAHHNQRRSFIASLGSLAALAIFSDNGVARAEAMEPGPQKDGKWDLSWIEPLKGKHRQVFDFGSRDLSAGGNPLRVPRNYMNAHNTVYGLADGDLSTIVGIAGSAFAMNASDRLWKDYALGEHFHIKDPATGRWAERNFFVDAPTGSSSTPPTASIQILVARGTIFWQCNNALNGNADELAQKTGKNQVEVRADLVAGLNPWVRLVPAHTMLLGLVQERGFTYEKL
ncbi:MAG: hypothetical protein H0W69_10170 [Gemmatimonadaceae bacterium]|nr:hypothetical protein [Gemmatimonadaceae bacterium]